MAKHIQINKTKMKMKSDHIKTTKIFYIFINNTKTIRMYYFSLLFGFVYWFYVSILPSFTHPHIIQTRNILCGSVVEHCVSWAKGCGFDSQGTHVLIKMYNLNAIVSRFG